MVSSIQSLSLILSVLVTNVLAFTCQSPIHYPSSSSIQSLRQSQALSASSPTKTYNNEGNSHSSSSTRKDFLTTSVTTTFVAVLGSGVLSPQGVSARGRATLEQAYDRYTPRIEAGGTFYATDLKRAIEKADWAAIKAATADPPKRSKEDKSKIDGGIAERAAQAGGFSDARVLGAADLWAASFSDNSVSKKTKAMKEQVTILRDVVEKLSYTSKVALGEEKASGGFFGVGGKKPSQSELVKECAELYVKGGNAWNQYIFLANDDLPIQLKRLPYL